ncbi:hypothetical protein ASPBRDRAFT_49072 [Aspergillus brasiliensis CBS 101740]|uniref:2EXR domain-containing protein n=1 Tax=Aspergillus brasiliensis (strain CBS 101740 / IMI 381727 / IBT 21946) TaxID=767769 RepID=A0A1L9U4E6_ASPBC|nr:hypothetical protein ASPBRDRAFT_49072 [Aspergillus brasiliensis CBS 101740]
MQSNHPPNASERSFSLFPLLPGELRNHIWHLALLSLIKDPSRPQLCFYRPGCGYWDPRYLTPSDPDYDPDDDQNISFRFHHDRLDPVSVCVPLVSVSREARGLVLPLLREWGYSYSVREDIYGNGHRVHNNHINTSISKSNDNDTSKIPKFTRPIDPLQDALYIAPNHLDDFLAEPWDRCFQPDLADKQISRPAPEMNRLALPVAGLKVREEQHGMVTAVVSEFYRTEEMFLVLGGGLDPGTEGQWLLEAVKGGPVWMWDPVGERLVLEERSEGIRYNTGGLDAVKRLVEAETVKLAAQLAQVNTDRFVMRMAVAVQVS